MVLAAGLSSRYGDLKQLAPVGPNGEALMDYSVYDAIRAGFTNVLLVVRPELEGSFRAHAEKQFGSLLSVDFVHQNLADLPPSCTLPMGRQKPWGTGHAVLAARRLQRPFVVCNADDYYGPAAFAALAQHLEVADSPGKPIHAIVGYVLRETLSDSGGVSRAVCQRDKHGFLEQVVEIHNISQRDGHVSGSTTAGKSIDLDEDAIVSMNLWGFNPTVFSPLQRQFATFVSEHGDEADSEFLLSTALNEQIAADESAVIVLPGSTHWFGLTFAADQPEVSRQIEILVGRGTYPRSLATAFRTQHREST